ncbi:Aste57867_3501 [Aphanomyces stellatus]|uniref:Aste57867_3501 protein n=1 Tax=Aphanomyces stellatus TaxID=120398 RepID=A0A485K9U1_9STRA|nr:hypothetical protein As57867_003490 [Aphanomyces stellatus]VFT80665.1 Aste57867_3501 [Aphanomyces stellatus]
MAAPTTPSWTPIDISPFLVADATDADRARVVDEVSRAFETLGFLLISHHGVDASVWEGVHMAAGNFFGQPDQVKRTCFVNRAPVPRGYSASGKENFAILSLTNQSKPNDLVEKYRMGPPTSRPSTDDSSSKDAQMMFYPNIWPQHDDGALQAAMERSYAAMRALSTTLFRIFAACLGLPHDFFVSKTTHPTHILSVNHYPPLGPQVQPGQLRLAQHTDVDIFTIVCPDYGDAFGCLQIEDVINGRWLSVPVLPDTLVVNLGDCFKFWTNGMWQSTSHRVMNPDSDDGRAASRQSIAFFVGANYDAPLECLGGRCCDADSCGHHGHGVHTYVMWRKMRVKQAMTQLKKKGPPPTTTVGSKPEKG